MKSWMHGESISNIEVTNISGHGLWLWVAGQEYFLSFDQYPWFKNATIAGIQHVELIHDHHVRWPDLDVDLELESIIDPKRYPMIAVKNR